MVSDRSTIVLAGMPCSGKSSVCRELNKKEVLRVLDLDEQIEVRTSRRVTDIIRVDGIARFRELETEILLDCLKVRPDFLSLGGGALISSSNQVAIHQAGARIVCLTAGVSVLARRAYSDEVNQHYGRPKRPLLFEEGENAFADPAKKILALLYDRWEVFKVAHILISTSFASAEEVANQLLKLAEGSDFTLSDRDLSEGDFGDSCLLYSSSEPSYRLWVCDAHINAHMSNADFCATAGSLEKLQDVVRTLLTGQESKNAPPTGIGVLLIDAMSLAKELHVLSQAPDSTMPDPQLLCSGGSLEEMRVKDIWPAIEEVVCWGRIDG